MYIDTIMNRNCRECSKWPISWFPFLTFLFRRRSRRYHKKSMTSAKRPALFLACWKRMEHVTSLSRKIRLRWGSASTASVILSSFLLTTLKKASQAALSTFCLWRRWEGRIHLTCLTETHDQKTWNREKRKRNSLLGTNLRSGGGRKTTKLRTRCSTKKLRKLASPKKNCLAM